jgi:ring-1,2-phenylacetyl-CoA epoxidase subunit PaaC
MGDTKFQYLLSIADNTLILGQRISAWCGHAPALEEDIAMANTALDLIGQATLWLKYAAELEGKGRSADDLAFLRTDRQFRNTLLVEHPNGDYGQTLVRQFLFDAWHRPFLTALVASDDPRIAEIAAKSVKEVTYHLERSSDLIIRLGDGNDQSHQRIQDALDLLWPFAGEFFLADSIEDEAVSEGYGVAASTIQPAFDKVTSEVFAQGSLHVDPNAPVRKGGKTGTHSEAFSFMLAEMQILQRSYPGAKW